MESLDFEIVSTLKKDAERNLLPFHLGPPTVACTWQHWSEFKGPYNDTPPNGQQVELYGMTIITLSEVKFPRLLLVFLLINYRHFKIGRPFFLNDASCSLGKNILVTRIRKICWFFIFFQKKKIEQLEMFFDASQFIQSLRGGKCPIIH